MKDITSPTISVIEPAMTLADFSSRQVKMRTKFAKTHYKRVKNANITKTK